jgi:hypothetical protein
MAQTRQSSRARRGDEGPVENEPQLVRTYGSGSSASSKGSSGASMSSRRSPPSPSAIGILRSAQWGLGGRLLRNKAHSLCCQEKSKATSALADAIFEGLVEGSSLINQLRRHNISARSFYRWRATNEEFRHRYEEAIAIRRWIFPERIIGMAYEVTPKNCRAKLAEAKLLEKAMAQIEGGRRRWWGS